MGQYTLWQRLGNLIKRAIDRADSRSPPTHEQQTTQGRMAAIRVGIDTVKTYS